MEQDLYELGSIPPLGQVPKHTYAAVIRQHRYGAPSEAMKIEIVDVPPVGRNQVLVFMMAAGVNYNNVWASLGHPVDVIASRQKQGELEDFHVGGSDGSGVVWSVGEGVSSVRVGDEVIVAGGVWDETAPDIRLGADPMTSSSARAWGYETNFGAFAQFGLADEYQCHPKPPNLTWERAGSFLTTGATAYRQLYGWPPNTVQPGDPVLVWGGAGGLGCIAIQLINIFGGVPVAVVSNEERAEFCRRLGARGTINRSDFSHWGRLPDLDDDEAFAKWAKGAREFGRAFWEVLGERRAPKIVLEHAGQDTIPTSIYLCDNAGMVVICGGSSGYHGDVDLRFLWMRQKRLQGSHGYNPAQCRSMIHLVASGQVDPCLSLVLPLADIAKAHQLLHLNEHPPGNIAVLVNAPQAGLITLPS
jgi:crotonyl-CoA carboxylase/reductase